MRRLLMASALIAASVPAAAATLTIDVFSGSTLVGTATSGTGVVNFNSSTIPGFDSIAVSADGLPAVTGGDLSSTTLDVSSASAGVHVLTVDVFQTGISVPAGSAHSTFTTNNLIGTPGPVNMTTNINGTSSTLGTQIASAAFAAGTTNATTGPITTGIPALFADAEQYRIVFTAPDQSSNDTIQLTTTTHAVIPETSTWVMLGIGFGVMAALGFRKQSTRFLEV